MSHKNLPVQYSTMATGGPSATTDKKEDVPALEQKVKEMSIQQVEEGADAKANRVSMSLRELVDRVERQMKEVTETTHTLTSQLISCTDDVTALQKKGDGLEEELERKTGELQSLVQSVNKSFGDTKELFSVRRLDQATTQQDQAMRFKEVDINDGGHYQPDTGRFTAPWPGVYLFSVGVKSNSNNTTVSGQIMVDNVLYRDVSGGSDGGSGFLLENLTAGQTVWVKAFSPVGQYGVKNGSRNWFRGTLVLQYP